MPVSLCGTWDMLSNVNFEGYMTALGISLYTRKVALRLKHRKVIEQVGDQYVIKTLSTFRNYTFSFKVNEEFQEFTKGLDDRHCKSLVQWGGNKIECVQKGEKKTEDGHTGLRMINSIWSCTVRIKSASKFSNGLSEALRGGADLKRHTDVGKVVYTSQSGEYGEGLGAPACVSKRNQFQPLRHAN